MAFLSPTSPTALTARQDMPQTGLEGSSPGTAEGAGGARGPGDPTSLATRLLRARGLTCAGRGLEADFLSPFSRAWPSLCRWCWESSSSSAGLNGGRGCGPYGVPVPSGPRARAPGQRVGLGVALPSRNARAHPRVSGGGAGPQQLLCPDPKSGRAAEGLECHTGGLLSVARHWNGCQCQLPPAACPCDADVVPAPGGSAAALTG